MHVSDKNIELPARNQIQTILQSRQPCPMSRTKSLLRHLLCRNIDNKGNDFHGFIPVTANAVAVPVLAHVVISGIQHGFHAVIRYQGLPLQNIVPFKLPMMLMYPNGCTRLNTTLAKVLPEP